MEEIVRREEVHASQADGSNFEPSQHSSPEALSERLQIDQQRLLYSLAHAEISPRTCDGRGYVRIIGAFADDEDLLHHCDMCSLILSRRCSSDMHGYSRTIERAANDALRDKIVAEALQMHAENVQRATDEFVAHKKVLLMPIPTTRRFVSSRTSTAATVKITTAMRATLCPPHSLPSGATKVARKNSQSARVCDQRFAVLSVLVPLHDSSEADEGALAGVYMARARMLRHLNKRMRGYAILKAKMCAIRSSSFALVWISADLLCSRIHTDKENYRHDELDRIMRFHREEPYAPDFEQWRKEHGGATKE